MFFEPASFGARKLSMEHFRDWAGVIANQYLHEGTLPTEALIKTAEAEDLTPDSINVLAAEVNKEIHRQKFAAQQDKYFAADFPLADAATAIRRLQADGGGEKIATAMPEPVIKKPEADPFDAFGVKPEAQDKTASVRHELRHAAEKLAAMERILSDRVEVLKSQIESTAQSFVKKAQQFVLDSSMNQAERVSAFSQLNDFIKAASMNFAAPLLTQAAMGLAHTGYLTKSQLDGVNADFQKTADLKAPEGLISETLPAQIVNGTHPLYITLKTFRDHSEALNLTTRQLKLTQDELRILKQKVRAL
jgi:hypothetical protein